MQRRAKIPNKPRFKYVSQMAYEFSDELGIAAFPVDPIKVIEHFENWHLRGWFDMKTQTKVQDPYNLEKDGAEAKIRIVRGTNDYVIVYDERVENSQRIRWTLAHEIGHIVLGHLDHFEATALNRSGLTDKQYGVLEVEAHWFAAELLAPKIVIKHFNYHDCREKLSLLCDISGEAVDKRLNKLKTAEYKYPEAAFRVLKNFYSYMIGLTDNALLDGLHANNIQLPAIYEDYIECDY